MNERVIEITSEAFAGQRHPEAHRTVTALKQRAKDEGAILRLVLFPTDLAKGRESTPLDVTSYGAEASFVRFHAHQVHIVQADGSTWVAKDINGLEGYFRPAQDVHMDAIVPLTGADVAANSINGKLAPDYRSLLVKYIRHVGDAEGVCFLEDRHMPRPTSKGYDPAKHLTPNEFAALQALVDEV